MQRAILLILVGTLFAGCATPAKKSDEPRTLDRQGVRVLGLLGGYLFPPSWSKETQVATARQMYPLEFHGNTNMGKTLIHALVLVDRNAMARILEANRQLHPSFKTSPDIEHAFGQNSQSTFDENGRQRELSWWEPSKHKNATYYFWGTDEAPRKRFWLRVSPDAQGEDRVYLRIESE